MRQLKPIVKLILTVVTIGATFAICDVTLEGIYNLAKPLLIVLASYIVFYVNNVKF